MITARVLKILPPIDSNQSAFQDKQREDWTSGGRDASPVFSGFPYSHSSAGIDTRGNSLNRSRQIG